MCGIRFYINLTEKLFSLSQKYDRLYPDSQAKYLNFRYLKRRSNKNNIPLIPKNKLIK